MQQLRERSAETVLPMASAAGGIEARRLRHDLRQSLREGGLVLAFQPRRRLHDHADLGSEAHLRWPCRGRGVLQASAFMPLINDRALAREVLAWSLDAACAAATGWKQGVVCLSVPAEAVRDASLLLLVGEALAKSGLDPERLEIGLNDSDLADECEDTLLALPALRDAGVGVALEEFGRTRACLMRLKHLPLSTIKLDRSLVREVAGDQAAAAMARSLIDYAHALGIDVVASVETADQRALLRTLGCDAGIER